MRKFQLISSISKQTGVDEKIVERVLDSFVDVVINSLKRDEEVTITSFGTFSAKRRKPRVGVNPRNTSQTIQIPSVRVAKFKAGSRLKKELKEDNHTPENQFSGFSDV